MFSRMVRRNATPAQIEYRERHRFRRQEEAVQRARRQLLELREVLGRMVEQNRSLTALRRQLADERNKRLR